MKTTRLIEIFEHDKEAKAVRELIDLANKHKRKQYPDVPGYALPKAKHDSRSANGLTSCILTWFLLHGHMARRKTSEGRYRPGEVITDVIGRRKEMPGKWLRGLDNGAADVYAIVRGRFIAIEVKVGQDRQSEIQKRYQQEVEQSGGVYFIARSFADFLTWWYGFESHKDHEKQVI